MTNYLWVNFYWMLYLIPGMSVYLFLNRKYPSYRLSPLSLFVFAFIYTSVLLSPFVILGYLFKFKITIISYFFYAFLVVSFFYFKKDNFLILKTFWSSHVRPTLSSGQLDFLKVIFYGSFIIFIIAASWVGSYQSGDAFVHVAKINKTLSNWISYGDPFVDLDITESRYHLTLLHPVIALGAYFLDLSPKVVWVHSSAFFNILSVTAFLSACRLIISSSRLPYVFTLIWMIYQVDHAFVKIYPNNIANYILIPLILTSLLVLLREKKPWHYINYVFCVWLLALTHILYSVFIVILVIGIYLVEWMFRFVQGERRFQVFPLIVTLGIFAPFLFFTISQPNYMPGKVKDWGDYKLFRIGDKYAFSPTPKKAFVFAIVGLVLFVQYRRKEIAGVTAIQVIAIYLIVYNVLYNPFVCSLVNRWLPLWSIGRIANVPDLFSTVYLFYIPFSIIEGRAMRERYKLITFAPFVLWVAYTQAHAVQEIKAQRSVGMMVAKKYSFLQRLKNDVKGGAVILSDIDTETAIPSYLINNVVALVPEHANPGVRGIMDRIEDNDLMLDRNVSEMIRLSLYNYYRVSYILFLMKDKNDQCLMVDRIYIRKIKYLENGYCLIALNEDKVRAVNFNEYFRSNGSSIFRGGDGMKLLNRLYDRGVITEKLSFGYGKFKQR